MFDDEKFLFTEQQGSGPEVRAITPGKFALSEEEILAFREMKVISLDQMSCLRLMERKDAKYILPVSEINSFLNRIVGSCYVQENQGKKIAAYETVYYDTHEMDFFHHHANGKRNRCKVRERRYADSGLTFLEVKKKTNKGEVIKVRIQINGNPLLPDKEINEFVREHAHRDFKALSPVLKSSFRRITLVNYEMTGRITLDFDLQYISPEKKQVVSLPNLAILEIKHEKSSDTGIERMMDEARIKKTGISKYCLGVALTLPNEKVNAFKRKLRKIQKITEHGLIA